MGPNKKRKSNHAKRKEGQVKERREGRSWLNGTREEKEKKHRRACLARSGKMTIGKERAMKEGP